MEDECKEMEDECKEDGACLDNFATTQVAEIVGVSIRQLDYWARKELVKPSVKQSCGQGTRRVYNLDDLIKLRCICRLRQSGMSIQKIHKAVNILKAVIDDPDPLKSAIVFHEEGLVLALFKTKKGERIMVDALSVVGQQVMGIVLETLAEETRLAVAQEK